MDRGSIFTAMPRIRGSAAAFFRASVSSGIDMADEKRPCGTSGNAPDSCRWVWEGGMGLHGRERGRTAC
ncbi:hypothetical protein F751_2121 [Auxenochlorella protothecoides]|uniref:Uncharacterized protein n=1 Tax=Auxenochlorella protothecoides TaxID=3075 RepID=A0A087SLD0_AUXPR|nr:hypothetical protein F751_2121 [Auxenochlorella protothecoides]KFM26534.1 hypothetical protein F751_2121 [Auxenochlorella protothecoides]